MTNTMKKVLTQVCTFILAMCVIMGIVTLLPVHATSSVITMDSTAQANIKSEEKSGLRFKANLDAEGFTTLIETYGTENVKAGMMILPTDLVTDAEGKEIDFTVSGIGAYEYNGSALSTQFTYYDYAKTYVKDSDNNAYYFYMTMPDIVEKNYNRDYTAKAFIEVTADSVPNAEFIEENGKYYSYTATTTTANVYEVAYDAYIQTDEDKALVKEEKDIAVKFLDNVAVLEYVDGEVKIANKVNGVYTAPYTIEKDGLGNFIVNGKGVNPATISYNEERKTTLTFNDTDNSVNVNSMLSQEATFGENNSVSLQSAQTNGTSSKGNLQALADVLGYVAFNGSYDVGTYISTTFKGNNMPQVMFFSNVIDGDLTGVAYNDETRQGVVAMNGVIGYGDVKNATNLYKVIGPNRMSASNYTSEYYINLNMTLDYDICPLLTQDGLSADTSETTYRYTVGTYLNDTGAIIWDVFLYNNDNNTIIYHQELALSNNAAGYNTLTKDNISASNIVIYSCLKGSKDLCDTEFSYTMPFSREELLKDIEYSGANINDLCNEATLTGVDVKNSLNGTWKAVDNSYIGFNNNYSLDTYLDLYYTGDNVPYVTFFADQIDGCMNSYDSSGNNTDPPSGYNRAGIMIASGGRTYSGTTNLGTSTTNQANCLYFYGPYKYNPASTYYTKYAVANYVSVENSNFTEILHGNAVEGKKYKLTYGMIDVDGSIYADITLSYLVDGDNEYTQICSLKLDTGVTVDAMKASLGITDGELVGKIIIYAAIKGAGNDTTFSFSRPYTKTTTAK